MIAKIVGLGAENYDDSFDIKIQEIQNELSDLSNQLAVIISDFIEICNILLLT